MNARPESDFDRWLSTSLGVAGPDGTRWAATHQGDGGASIADAKNSRFRARERRWCRDYERLITDPAVTRLEGVTQVLPPCSSASSRLSHSRTVAELASAVAEQLGLDPNLAAAIGISHDCGHPAFAHAGEHAIRQYRPDFSHAQWGASRVLAGRGYSIEVRDGVRSHSWSEGGCRTPEAEIVRWADRIAYLTEDLADAIALALVGRSQVPHTVATEIGVTPDDQQIALTAAVVDASRRTGRISMENREATVLAEFRMFNAAAIYQHSDVVTANRTGERQIHAAVKALRGQGANWPETISRIVTATDAQIEKIYTASNNAA